MLDPRLADPEVLEALRERWRATRSIRIDRFLAEDVGLAVVEALRGEAFTISARPSWSLGFQYFEYSFVPEPDCDHVLCRFGRWWLDDARRWLEALTGMDLVPVDDRSVVSSWYSKGCYLGAHNDYDGKRALAFIVGLTRERWGPEVGGYLEMLAVRGERIEVSESRPPGWCTLDIFDVSDLSTQVLHRISLVKEHVERRAIVGWFYRPT